MIPIYLYIHIEAYDLCPSYDGPILAVVLTGHMGKAPRRPRTARLQRGGDHPPESHEARQETCATARSPGRILYSPYILP